MEDYAGLNDIGAVVEADRAHVWHHLSQHKQYETVDPRVIVEGKGMRVWDAKGKEHIDAVSGGVWTVNVGYGRESIANAVRDQLIKLNYFAGAAGSIPGSIFAKRLIEKMPGLTRVYYSNSGSEANEKVYKMVRQIAHRHHGGKKWKILYRDRDYHGTTIAALPPPARTSAPCNTGPSRTASSASRTAWNTASSGTSKTTASAPLTPSRKSSCAKAPTPSAA
jgi:taurine-pyruvate aminotransferase